MEPGFLDLGLVLRSRRRRRVEGLILESGRLAGMKDIEDRWHVDRAALVQLFPAQAFPVARAATTQSATGHGRPLDAATLALEVGLSALVKQAGDKLRRRSWWWRRAG
jgi:hypothetical protein